MRLPIQSMQAVLIKPIGPDDDSWFRSVIVDFDPDRELVVVLPGSRDRRPPDASIEPAEVVDEPEAQSRTGKRLRASAMGRQSFPDRAGGPG